MENVTQLLLVLVVGLILGGSVAWLILRASRGTDGAEASRQIAESRTEAEQARADAANARAEAANARAEAAYSREDLADARAAAAAAEALAERARADVAEVRSERDTARAEATAAQKRSEELAADRETMVNQFKVLSSETLDRHGKQAEASHDQRFKATERLMTPVRESLERFNARLTDVEKERATMAAELRAQVEAVQMTGESMRRETTTLVNALRKPQVRGQWGEMQLKRVVEVSGMVEHCDFIQQATAQTSAETTIRPDMKVTLSEGKFVYVDSKVPLGSFLDAHDAPDDAGREAKLGQFARTVRNHVDQLSKKDYFKAGTSNPEFVVLFLPSEALAAEALAQLPDLHEYAARKDVILATPTTLIAMLRAVAYGWRQAALAESAQQVSELGRELYDRLGILGGHFDKVGRSLTSTVRSYNEAVGSLEGRVLPTARKLRDLQVTTKQLETVHAVETAVRPLVAAELLGEGVRPEREQPRRKGRPQIALLPEGAELVRPQPTLEDIATETTVHTGVVLDMHNAV
ncbi:MAG TPA: DNA recombination protein RmuC [Propionibacteriaceae bacterium]|nr:DNA recombination protein RmuC [Micropruina sp.]HBX79724.1 DNA recombination protein RmuC [Propionibacteriaceae bacterium]HBY23122.1 DNA recombination protein RmuC [Propionibacteriaceae bacterium]